MADPYFNKDVTFRALPKSMQSYIKQNIEKQGVKSDD